MQGIAVLLNCFYNCLCQFSISFQEVQCGFWTEAPAAFAIFQLLFLLFLCSCQGHPHRLLHSAGFASVLYQSLWQCLLSGSLLLIAASLSLPAECSFSSGRRGFIDGATRSPTSSECAGKWNVTSEEFDGLSARAPRWTDAAIKQAPLSPRCMLCIPECTSAAASLNLRRGSALKLPTVSLFLLSFWDTNSYVCSVLPDFL